jgi:hypothetical protein
MGMTNGDGEKAKDGDRDGEKVKNRGTGKFFSKICSKNA